MESHNVSNHSGGTISLFPSLWTEIQITTRDIPLLTIKGSLYFQIYQSNAIPRLATGQATILQSVQRPALQYYKLMPLLRLTNHTPLHTKSQITNIFLSCSKLRRELKLHGNHTIIMDQSSARICLGSYWSAINITLTIGHRIKPCPRPKPRNNCFRYKYKKRIFPINLYNIMAKKTVPRTKIIKRQNNSPASVNDELGSVRQPEPYNANILSHTIIDEQLPGTSAEQLYGDDLRLVLDTHWDVDTTALTLRSQNIIYNNVEKIIINGQNHIAIFFSDASSMFLAQQHPLLTDAIPATEANIEAKPKKLILFSTPPNRKTKEILSIILGIDANNVCDLPEHSNIKEQESRVKPRPTATVTVIDPEISQQLLSKPIYRDVKYVCFLNEPPEPIHGNAPTTTGIHYRI